MPNRGEYQKPAGVELNGAKPILGSRTMRSINCTIASTLTIDNCTYKGNAVLNANR